MIEKKKTFSQMIDEGYTYPTIVDAATQATIFDWFQYRRVTDNAKFNTYFNRVLNRDYHRYRQMMRIEPGVKGDSGSVTNFDWLVTEYLERLEEREYNGSRSESNAVTVEGSTTGSNSQVHGGTTVTATEGSGSTTHGLSTTRTDSSTGGTTSTGTGSTESTENSDSANLAETRTAELKRVQPNAQAYTDSDLNANDNRRGYITDTNDGYNAGEKAYDPQTDTDSSYTVGLHRNFPDLKIKNPTGTSDAHATASTIGSTKGTTTGSSTDSNTTETTNSGTSTTANSGTDRTTNEGETTVTHGQTVTDTSSGSNTQETTGTSSGQDQSTGNTKTRHTGHNGEIAEILERAKNYIETTNAWDWFKGQLETCFMACLD